MNLPIIILGAGGHAKVLIAALLAKSTNILGLTDPSGSIDTLLGIPIIGNDDAVLKYSPDKVRLVNGMGSINITTKRRELYETFKRSGYSFAEVIHPSAIVAQDVELSEGVQVMAGAIVQPGSKIGENSLVNTKAAIDHDCLIGSHVHIAPGVTLSGCVQVGDGVHMGVGTVVIQGIRIGKKCLIGAGSVVINDILDEQKVFGVPAKTR